MNIFLLLKMFATAFYEATSLTMSMVKSIKIKLNGNNIWKPKCYHGPRVSVSLVSLW